MHLRQGIAHVVVIPLTQNVSSRRLRCRGARLARDFRETSRQFSAVSYWLEEGLVAKGQWLCV